MKFRHAVYTVIALGMVVGIVGMANGGLSNDTVNDSALEQTVDFSMNRIEVSELCVGVLGQAQVYFPGWMSNDAYMTNVIDPSGKDITYKRNQMSSPETGMEVGLSFPITVTGIFRIEADLIHLPDDYPDERVDKSIIEREKDLNQIHLRENATAVYCDQL